MTWEFPILKRLRVLRLDRNAITTEAASELLCLESSVLAVLDLRTNAIGGGRPPSMSLVSAHLQLLEMQEGR